MNPQPYKHVWVQSINNGLPFGADAEEKAARQITSYDDRNQSELIQIAQQKAST